MSAQGGPPALDAEQLGPRCLVTGGSGYLGRALVTALLERGCRVRSLDLAQLDPQDVPCERLEAVAGDVRILGDVRQACRDVDVVYHTVALIDLLSRYRPERRRRVFDVNVLGTRNVLRACRELRIARLVHTSTINVAMGAAVRNGDETLPTLQVGQGGDLYGESKAEAEREVLAADTPGGLRTLALRLAGLWGPGRGAMMIEQFLDQLASGNFRVLIGNGSTLLDNTHRDNAIDAHLRAAAALRERPERAGGQAYFITDGEPTNGLEWFRPLVEGLGEPWPRWRIPAGLMLRVGALLEWVHYLGGPEPALTRRGMLNLSRDASFSIDKAREDLGYCPHVRSLGGIEALLPELRARYRSGSDA